MPDKEEKPELRLRRLLTLARPEIGRLTVATFALLLSAGSTLVYPQAIRFIIDDLGGRDAPFSYEEGAVLLVLLFLVQATFGTLRTWLFTVAGERIVARLRGRLFEAILGQDIEFFDRRRTGELTNRLAADTTVVQSTVTGNVAGALRYALQAVGGAAFLVWMSPRMTGVAMAVVPVGAVAAAWFGRKIRHLSRRVQDALAASSAIAEETIAPVSKTAKSSASRSTMTGIRPFGLSFRNASCFCSFAGRSTACTS